ncbi:uncharacterized protein BDR25DRAFT_315310 [Lindgomyces ingoldianus]|uniref:Uncharacterized protein n=1 Tax=Lindgomyces ingoldianus TaxID=673940 RepID=A0ACB6QSK2_9PLEO|nr:uncharacterized protein BDR25DRAFT_315310 [Lindgomyces ingoldianus]KAF2469272.1 hypothetical protein BDR25DRAFT_315310 [Lindgomyces ingoldianus]
MALVFHLPLFIFTFLLTLLPTRITATRSDIQIHGIIVRNKQQCPFNVTGTISPDVSYLELSYDTSSVALASFGSGIPSSENTRKCYVSVSYTFLNDAVSQSTITNAEVRGNVMLDGGVEARVDMSTVWQGKGSQNDVAPEQKWSQLLLSGPKDTSTFFSTPLTNATQLYRNPDCGQLAPTRTYEFLWILSTFSVSGTSAVGKDAKGAFGGKTAGGDGVFKQKFNFEWKSSCEIYNPCPPDRYGGESCCLYNGAVFGKCSVNLPRSSSGQTRPAPLFVWF